jgi:hypothetical protein
MRTASTKDQAIIATVTIGGTELHNPCTSIGANVSQGDATAKIIPVATQINGAATGNAGFQFVHETARGRDITHLVSKFA